ncbi:hypothetical protein HPP92_008464 [Vanilla planifolia]|uniref:Uncharacterized protein n=1 Tax=Vanilla planifolia TaxID=51239 RepID=A0A835V3S6_VANPL|nr:hypothetical protein HPP92_008464 [Vanilla planifolia]
MHQARKLVRNNNSKQSNQRRLCLTTNPSSINRLDFGNLHDALKSGAPPHLPLGHLRKQIRQTHLPVLLLHLSSQPLQLGSREHHSHLPSFLLHAPLLRRLFLLVRYEPTSLRAVAHPAHGKGEAEIEEPIQERLLINEVGRWVRIRNRITCIIITNLTQVRQGHGG